MDPQVINNLERKIFVLNYVQIETKALNNLRPIAQNVERKRKVSK